MALLTPDEVAEIATMAKSQKPKKPKTPPATERRTRILKAKLAGTPTAAIARAEGLRRETIRAALESDDCQQIILALVRQNVSEIDRLFHRAMVAINQAFDANKIAMYLGGEVDLGPDHYARLAAAKRYLELVALGRPTPKPKEDNRQVGMITVEELKRVVAERREAGLLQ